MVYRRKIVALGGILALRDGEPSKTKRQKQEGLSTMITSREIRLKSRPVGMPSADDFELATVSVPRPPPGEVQVQNLWMAVDPYMRGRMAHRASYVPSFRPGKKLHGGAIGEIAAANSTMYGWRPPFQLGEALEGGAFGEVAASDDPRFKSGDLVSSWLGWRERFNAPAGTLQKLDTFGLPPQAFLGVAGMPGLTAWVGLLTIAMLKPGDVVFVSAASGAKLTVERLGFPAILSVGTRAHPWLAARAT
jgi:NADPH-dependent curcumin reductase CurA